jgi:hypothetical protein
MKTHSRRIRSAGLALLFLGTNSTASAQEGPFTPWTGERGVTETVDKIMERQRALPPRPHAVEELDRETIRLSRRPQPNPASPAVSQWPPAPNLPAPGTQPAGTSLAFTVGSSFLGVQSSESPWVPPDTGGAVGPTQVLFSENGRIKVFGKDGTPGPLDVDADVFFQSVRNGFSAVDPQTKYDRLSGRFLLTCITFGPPNRVVIAVSSGSTITGAGSFTFFFFQQDQVAPVGNIGEFADYDKIGVDANALYVGANMWNSSLTTFTGSNCFVVRKSSILSGGPIVATAFRGIANAVTGVGPVYPMGVDNDDPASTEGYVCGVDGATSGTLTIRRISNPGGSPSISGNLFVTTPTMAQAIPQPTLGSASPLDALDYQILYDVQMHRDRASGARTLWAAHTIEVNSSGVATSGGNRNGARWYQIGNLSTTPALIQSGTLFDPAAVNPRGFIMPSCAMSGQGHMLLGASYAGVTERAGCAVAGRLAGDPLGTIAAPTFAVVSTTNYNVQGGTSQRWGDMSKVDVDPVDDQTLWAFAEYCNADNSWGVRVIQILAPPPATPTGAAPPSLLQGATNQPVVLTGTSAAGSGFYDTEPGFNRMQVAIDGTGVSVTNIAFNGPTQITLTVSVAAGAPVGPRIITVTNPDGQSVASASGIFSVQGGSPGTPFCFGDGTLPTPCPCGNTGAAGHGCANSAEANGALLGSSGTISPDTVVLAASGERATALTIFLQGNTNASAGIPFGDGVRCANGVIKRLYVKNAIAGSISAPQAGDPSITARSAALGDPIAPGSSRYYHTYFRDPTPAFCPPNTFNSTNGVQIDW